MTQNQPSGWYPDPTGRADHRYWDGNAWTDDVSRAGVQGTDAVAGDTSLTSRIEITATFFPLAFLLFLFPPTFVVDGQSMRGGWRQPTTVPVAPGVHQVRVFFRYFGMMDAGIGDTQVEVASGSVRRVTYKAPWLIFLRGRMVVQ